MSLAGAVSSVVKFTARPNEFLLIRARSCGTVICPVEGGARPVTSPPQPVARIRATVNLRLDQIRRVPLHCPPGHRSPPSLSQREPRNICFEMHCSAACLHHNKPLFFISPLPATFFYSSPSFFSPSLLPMSSPSVLEHGSRLVMSARKAHPV